MIWSEEKISQLEALYETDLSCRQIGAILGISRNAVIGKVHRLGLPRRGNAKPVVDAEVLAERAKRQRENQAASQRLRRAVEAARLGKEPKKEEGAVVFNGHLNIPFVDLREYSLSEPNQCRYICGEVTGLDTVACGVETDAGESYCAHCYAVTHSYTYTLSPEAVAKKRAHFIKIGNASRSAIRLGDAA